MLRRKRLLWIIPLGFVALLAATALADWYFCLPPGIEPRYVGGQSCVECHQAEYQRWQGSDHDWAMLEPTPDTVLGDFDDAIFEHEGVTTRFFRQGDDFFVHTEGPDGQMHDYRVEYTFGVRPLQQYLIRFPRGRLQCLTIAWDTERGRWFHLYPDQKVPHDDWHHWTGHGQNWNHMCAECHSTNLQKNYDVDTDTFHTTWSDINVSCEACHGPGSLHIELANSRSLFWDRRYGYGLARLKGPNNKTQLETCAQCHSRHAVMYPGHKPGDEFLDHYLLTLLDDECYFADGQVLGENYVYGSFLQSRMYREGVRCTDCHDPHSTRVKFTDNRLCTQCHTPGRYDGPVHHHHPIGSKGASCVDCHMPERTYMVVDPRRDHSIRVPRPDLTVKLGVPNACQNCHTKPEETAEWAADKIVEWYGPKRQQDPHFGEIIAAARHGRPEVEHALIDLAEHKPGQDKAKAVGPMVRASATALLGRYGSRAAAAALEERLNDPEPLVRAAAVRSFQPQDFEQFVRGLGPRLDDTARVVRIEAARMLSQLGPRVPGNLANKFNQALAEWERGQLYNGDQATSHLNLAGVYTNLGRTAEADSAFQTALKLEPDFVPARIAYATFLHLNGRSGEAESQLRTAIDLAPRAQVADYQPELQLAEAWYALGKLLDEFEPEPRRAEALAALRKAVELSPENPVMRYNLGVRLQIAGQFDEAEHELQAALRLNPESLDGLYALVYLYTQRGDRQQAERFGRQWVERHPPQAQRQAVAALARLLDSLRQPDRPTAAGVGPAPP